MIRGENMKTDTIKMSFKEGFKGEMTSPSALINIGGNDHGAQPYHLLYGALGSCFYATFLSISDKMRLSFDRATLEVSGTKRETSPTTLDYVKIEMVVYQPNDEVKLLKAAELGAKHCSIHETISKVATIELVVTFEN
jgi:putative redox protein